MDNRVGRARELHRNAMDTDVRSALYRAMRNRLIRQIWAEEREKWTWASLGKQIGCSPELIGKILREGR